MDYTGTGLALLSPIGGMIYGAITGNEAQEKLMQTQLAQERMIAQRDRLNQVRQLRTQTAAVEQAGANQGVSGSSSIAGGKATVYGQVGQNLQFIDNQQMYGQVQTKERQDYADAQGVSQLSQDMFNLMSKAAMGGF